MDAATNPASLTDRILHGGFAASILMKGAIAAFELASGLLLLLFGARAMASAQAFTATRMGAHPHDLLARHLHHLLAGWSIGVGHFYALYFISHGLVKLVLVIGLWHEAKWAFPTSIVALFGFIFYQLYVYSQSGAIGLLVLSGFDLMVIALIWREYQARRRAGLA